MLKILQILQSKEMLQKCEIRNKIRDSFNFAPSSGQSEHALTSLVKINSHEEHCCIRCRCKCLRVHTSSNHETQDNEQKVSSKRNQGWCIQIWNARDHGQVRTALLCCIHSHSSLLTTSSVDKGPWSGRQQSKQMNLRPQLCSLHRKPFSQGDTKPLRAAANLNFKRCCCKKMYNEGSHCCAYYGSLLYLLL